MRPTNLTRYGFDLGGETHNYDALRHYVCNECGGKVTHRIVWDEALDKSVDKIACAKCGGEDIISEWTYDKQIADGLELKQSQLYQQHMRQARKEGSMPLKDIKPQARAKRIETIRLGWTEETPNSNWDKVVASDHFVLTDAPILAKLFEGKDPPKVLPIYFPHRTFDENIVASYGVWVGGAKDKDGKHKGGFRVCHGDGGCVQSALPFKARTDDKGNVRVNRAPGPRWISWGKAATDFEWDGHKVSDARLEERIDFADLKWDGHKYLFREGQVVPCPGRRRDLYTHCEACSTSILIKIRIRDARVARFGYWQISTQSINNYLHLMSVWDDLTLQPDGSRLPISMSEVPFVLSIEPGATLYQNQKDQMWSTREAYFLKLELDPVIAQLEQDARERRIVALLSGRTLEEPMVLLPPETEPEFPEPLPFDDPPIEDAEYDDAMSEDYEEEADAPLEQIEYVAVPKDLTHKNIIKLAMEQLGYKNVGQVKGAMYAIIQDTKWEKSTEWSPKDVWFQLQEYLRAPA